MPLLTGLLAALAYTLMQILFKRGATYAAHPLALTAWLGLLAPFWAFLLYLGLSSHLLTFTYSHTYLAYTALWAASATGTLALMVSLIQRLPLIQLTAYRKAFAAAIALFADVLLLATPFKPLTLLAIALILGSSLLLPSPHLHKNSSSQTKALLATFLLAALLTGQLYAYQQALKLQPDVLSHVFCAKALMALFSLGLWLMPAVRTHTKPAGWPLMAAIVLCFVVASVAEGLALQALPVTLVIITSFVAAACFTAHDVLTRELPLTRPTLLKLAAIFTGFALLALKW